MVGIEQYYWSAHQKNYIMIGQLMEIKSLRNSFEKQMTCVNKSNSTIERKTNQKCYEEKRL